MNQKLASAIAENRNLWIVYVFHEQPQIEISEVCSITKLAESTIQKYAKKYKSQLEEARIIFDPFYFFPRTNWSDYIDTNDIDLLDNATQKCYLFRFYNADKELVCSKVGTTQRTVRKRLIEEMRSKTYSNCRYAIIDRVYDCGDRPAEGLESLIRAEYIKKYPQSFKKNDRFISELFDLEEVDKIVKGYFE